MEKAEQARRLADFFLEAGVLKHTFRNGWRLVGIGRPETVAEHSFRAAIIAFLIAKAEGANAQKACIMALFHDVPEARIGDLDRIQAAYLDKAAMEKKAVADQAALLGDGKWYPELHSELDANASAEAVIAHDADLLELGLTALEYKGAGGFDTEEWAKSAHSGLRTAAAKMILEHVARNGVDEWWQPLKKL